MSESVTSFEGIDDLRRYVAETLAGLEALKADEWQLSQQMLVRSGKPCGVHFCLHGPRSICLSAIWELEGNSILFYRSCGRRAKYR